MKRVFKLRCEELGKVHGRFTVFDPSGANCGVITVRAADVADFVYHAWHGRVIWQRHHLSPKNKRPAHADAPASPQCE